MRGKKGKVFPRRRTSTDVYRGWVLFFAGRKYRYVSALLLLFLTATFLHASDYVEWKWKSEDSDVLLYRWQLDGEDEGKWTEVDSSVTSVSLPVTGGSVLFVQSSLDGIHWSESGTAEYTSPAAENSGSVRFSFIPYSLALYRFYNGYDTVSTRTRTASVYGIASSLEADFSLSPFLRIFPETGFDYIVKADSVIPGACGVWYFNIGGGMDLVFSAAPGLSVYGGISVGTLAHISNSRANITAYFRARAGVEKNLSDDLCVGVMTRTTLSFLKGRQSLLDSATILIETLGVTLQYRI